MKMTRMQNMPLLVACDLGQVTSKGGKHVTMVHPLHRGVDGREMECLQDGQRHDPFGESVCGKTAPPLTPFLPRCQGFRVAGEKERLALRGRRHAFCQ